MRKESHKYDITQCALYKKKSSKQLKKILYITEEEYKDILSIVQKSNSILLQLKPEANINPENITTLITNGKGKYLFTAGASPYITMKITPKEKESIILDNIKILLQALKC